MGREKNMHAGHRSRVKAEFLSRGLEGWSEHRVLELILFYAIPQGDVNALAHELIEQFGSLAGVLDAMPEELEKVEGVGSHTATLLRLIPAVGGRYLAGRTSMHDMVNTSREAYEVLAPYFYGARNEMVYLLCLDGKNKVLGVRRVSEGSINAADVNVRRIVEEAMALRASQVYLAHNHVSNLPFPSRDDKMVTDYLRQVLEPIGIDIRDHLVFVDGDMVSFRDSGLW